MNWRLPNQLTVGRIALAGGFFVLLGLYQPGTVTGRWLLNAAFVVYLLAGATDVLDGYLARKMNAVTAFGRIVDPFVDKVLTLGAFAMLTGRTYVMDPRFASSLELSLPMWVTGHMATAVQAWMVVAIMAREMIVSAVRGYSESCGITFAATPAGKIKLFLQSVAICAILYQLANQPQTAWAIWMKIVSVWLAVVVTALSGLAYAGRVRGLLRSDEK